MEPDLSHVSELDYNLATRLNIGDTIVRFADLHPDRAAVVQGDQEITYQELASVSDRVGHALLGLGAKSGDPIAVMLPNRWELFATYFGCARAGLVFMPINLMLGADDVNHIVQDSGARIVVIDAAELATWLPVLEDLPQITEVIVVGDAASTTTSLSVSNWQDLVDAADDAPLEVHVDDRQTVQCMYTSGTTSRPKGVLINHVAVCTATLSNGLGLRLTWGEPQAMLVVLPLFHITALNTLSLTMLGAGGTVVLGVGRFDAAAVLDTIEQRSVTHMLLLPMMYQAMMAEQEKTPRDLSAVRAAIYAMAPMPKNLLHQVSETFPNAAVILGSGQTEVVPVTVIQLPEHEQTAPDSWGIQAPSVRVGIMDGAGELVPTDESGEIAYRAGNVCRGYWNNPSANGTAFAHGWFHSGDVGHKDAEAVVWLTDRIKDIIKTGGENVSSVQVEAVVLAAPGVAAASVVGVPHEKWGEAVCAVVVPDGSVPEEELQESVLAHVRRELGGFQVPKHVEIVDQLPTTATGKIQKASVRKMIARS